MKIFFQKFNYLLGARRLGTWWHGLIRTGRLWRWNVNSTDWSSISADHVTSCVLRCVTGVESCVPVLVDRASHVKSHSVLTFQVTVAIGGVWQKRWLSRIFGHGAPSVSPASALCSNEANQQSGENEKFHRSVVSLLPRTFYSSQIAGNN